RFGHREGDAILKLVVEVAVYVTRASDMVARFEGDAVALVFEGTSPEQAQAAVERIRSVLDGQPYQTDAGTELPIRLAVGVTSLGAADDDAKRALARAAMAAAGIDTTTGGIAMVSSADEAATSGSALDGEATALVGTTLGGVYRILHEIGSGGGGGVYRGEDLALRRPVAIKVMRPDLARSRSLVDRFRDEAAILAALRHPNLVQVYAFGGDESMAYFVMELVEGESIYDTVERSRREKTRVPASRVSAILRQVASALHTLHQSGIIHRDVKPANVLLDPFRDRAVLVDVGIASRSDESTFTAGTPGYMAPEAATSTKLTPSSDVYGLAATTFELLVLQPPWPLLDDPLEMLRHQRDTPPDPPSSYVEGYAPLDSVFLKALAPDPDVRFQTVRDFVSATEAALRRVDTHLPDTERPSKPSDIATAATKRPPITRNPITLSPAPTLSWSLPKTSGEARTRAVVFRSLPRVLGARTSAAWRLELARREPALGDALSPSTPPLGWLPTETLLGLLRSLPEDEKRDGTTLARDLGRASLRATFRRFFPASVATLSPASVLQSVPKIWLQYHSWGEVQVGIPQPEYATVEVRRGLRDALIDSWVRGMLEQLLILAGGEDVFVDDITESPEEGDPHATSVSKLEASWTWDPQRAKKPWRS
ncbi:MAG: protein kinase, partial [Myxococcota bacterium]